MKVKATVALVSLQMLIAPISHALTVAPTAPATQETCKADDVDCITLSLTNNRSKKLEAEKALQADGLRLKNFVEKHPNDFIGLFSYAGFLLSDIDDPKAAIKFFKRAKALAQSSTDKVLVSYMLGHAYYKVALISQSTVEESILAAAYSLNELEEARAMIDQVKPEVATYVLNLLGEVYHASGKYKEAREVLSIAVQRYNDPAAKSALEVVKKSEQEAPKAETEGVKKKRKKGIMM